MNGGWAFAIVVNPANRWRAVADPSRLRLSVVPRVRLKGGPWAPLASLGVHGRLLDQGEALQATEPTVDLQPAVTLGPPGATRRHERRLGVRHRRQPGESFARRG